MSTNKLLRDYVGRCDFNVGALFSHDGFIIMLYEACKKNSLPFPVDYVFGSIPCALQGGRAAPFTFSNEQAKEILDRYARMGVGCRLTFSNSEVTEEGLQDEASNFLLNLLNAGKNNGVIVTSDLLAGYIREHYPSLQLISSLVKPTVETRLGSETPDYYNALLERFDIVVMNSAVAYSDEYLNQIDRKDKVEFIVNHRCRPNCPMSCDHYITQTRAARAATTQNKLLARRLEGKLTQINKKCREMRQENPFTNSLISTERIKQLVDMGFVHFKLEGRDYPENVLARDMGNWIYEPESMYLSLAMSILGTPV